MQQGRSQQRSASSVESMWKSVVQSHMYAHHQHANERGHQQYSSALEIEGWEWEQELLKQSERKKKGSKCVSIWRVDIRPRIKGGNGSHHNAMQCNDDCNTMQCNDDCNPMQ